VAAPYHGVVDRRGGDGGLASLAIEVDAGGNIGSGALRSRWVGARVGERLALAGVFTVAARRYWLTVFPRVCRELARWRRRSTGITDPRLRQLASDALGKRGNVEGAAALAAFAPRARRGALVRALVAFQAAYDYADMLAEQPSSDPVRNGRRLHSALLVALDPGAGHPDYYEHHPQRDDGGYLDELVDTCRGALGELPSYAAVATWAQRAAARIVTFQSLSLDDPGGGGDALERYARAQTPPGSGLRWWETAAAGGSSLGVYALVAAAADPVVDPREIAAIESAYFPWIGAFHSLLDGLVDEAEDAEIGQLSLFGCYACAEEAATRMRSLAVQAVRRARGLPAGRRHALLVAAMAGYYLSAPEASAPGVLPVSRGVLETLGDLARPALLVFKIRRR
jgi:tetraprenyl-beta-curcumene synthase